MTACPVSTITGTGFPPPTATRATKNLPFGPLTSLSGIVACRSADNPGHRTVLGEPVQPSRTAMIPPSEPRYSVPRGLIEIPA